MRVIDIQQQTEEWESWRNRPTASEFHCFITPARGDYSAQATAYAAKIVAKRLGVYTEPQPTYWMEHGTEQEPNARHAYEQMTGNQVTEVGFIIPDGTDAYGGSPDGLVGDDGLIEIKCPAPETLISYHSAGKLPSQYKPQIQGLLLISGRAWCDFFVFYPSITPFLLRVEPDYAYQERLADGLLKLLREIERIEKCVKREQHEMVAISTMRAKVRFDDE